MLSLKRIFNRMEREERLYQAALGCYLDTLSLFEESPLETGPEVFRAHRTALREIHSEIAGTREPEVLEKSLDSLKGVLRSYYSKAGEISSQKTEDLHAVMAALGEAAELLGQQYVGNAEKLNQFTIGLQETGKITDLGQMRRQIVHQVADLRLIGETMQGESSQTLSTLQSKLREFNKRLHTAEQRACMDGLTGILNRGEGEARLGRIVESGRTASAILFDLNGFKQINDAWGHSAGDQVLKTFAQALTDHTRTGDLVCRWGGDEFLVIILCPEPVAVERAKFLKKSLDVPQKIIVSGKIYETHISASLGVTGLRDKESAEDFLARVDAEMYRDKRGRTHSSELILV